MDEDDVDEVMLQGVQVVGQFVRVLVFVEEVTEVGPMSVLEGVQVEM
jgi:hypothetical protein